MGRVGENIEMPGAPLPPEMVDMDNESVVRTSPEDIDVLLPNGGEIAMDDIVEEEAGVVYKSQIEGGTDFNDIPKDYDPVVYKTPEETAVIPVVEKQPTTDNGDFYVEIPSGDMASTIEEHKKNFTLSYKGEEVGLLSESLEGYVIYDKFVSDNHQRFLAGEESDGNGAVGVSHKEAQEVIKEYEEHSTNNINNQEGGGDCFENDYLQKITKFFTEHKDLSKAAVVIGLTSIFATGCATMGSGNYNDGPYEATKSAQKSVRNTRKKIQDIERAKRSYKKLKQKKSPVNFLRGLERVVRDVGRIVK